MASATPAPPMDPGLVTAAPIRPLTELSWPTKPALSAPTTGTSGVPDSTSASTITLSMPDVQMPSNGRAGGDEVEDLLLALILLPPGRDFMDHLDVRELGEGALEALVAVAVRRRAGSAAHIDDITLAAQLLEQPLGAEIGVVFLVVRDDIGRRVGHRLIHRHHHDPGLVGLLERGIDAGGIGGIDDDRIHLGADQVADVLELARGIGIAMRDVQRGDLARRQRLGLHGAHHLLAPAVALHGVRNADGVVLAATAAAAESAMPPPRRA